MKKAVLAIAVLVAACTRPPVEREVVFRSDLDATFLVSYPDWVCDLD